MGNSNSNQFVNTVIIDDSLEPATLEEINVYHEIPRGFKPLFLSRGIDLKTIITSSAPLNEPTVTDKTEDGIKLNRQIVTHRNFIEYLTIAWANHLSVSITPDMTFYTILCELACTIKSDPEKYRNIFTTSGEKKTILFTIDDVTKIDLDQIVGKLIEAIPDNIGKLFSIKFSTTTKESQVAMSAAFCDGMSVYYEYMSTLCGIPRIKLLGTPEDWILLESTVGQLVGVFKDHKEVVSYLKGCVNCIHKMYTTTDPKFWKKMFQIVSCGSGHTDEVKGWICELFRPQFTNESYYHFDSHISTVQYKNVETDRSFELLSGLMYSTIHSGKEEKENETKTESEDKTLDDKYPFLEPHFSHAIRELNLTMTDLDYQVYLSQLSYSDKDFVMHMNLILNKQIIIDPRRKREQEMELRTDAVLQWIDWAENFHENAVSVFNMSYEWDILSRIQPKAGEETELGIKLCETIAKFISHPRGPHTLSFIQLLPIYETVVYKGLETTTTVKKINFSNFISPAGIQYLSLFLKRPDCPLEELCGIDFTVPYHIKYTKKEKEDVKKELIALEEALASSPAPIRVLSSKSSEDPLINGMLSIISKKDSSVREYTPCSQHMKICKSDARKIINTLYRSNPLLEVLNIGYLMAAFEDPKYPLKGNKKAAPEDNASNSEMISRMASYLSNATLHTLEISTQSSEIMKAIATNQNIRHLKIYFERREDEDYSSLLSPLFSVPPHLDSFYVYLQWGDITSEVANWIQGSKDLKDLEMIITSQVVRKGAAVIAKALQGNGALESINLQYSVIGTEATEEIVKCIQERKENIKNIKLKGLDIDVKNLIPILVSCSSLVEVKFGCDRFHYTESDVAMIAAIIQNNPNLKSLNLSGSGYTATERELKLLLNAMEGRKLSLLIGQKYLFKQDLERKLSEELPQNTTTVNE